MDDFDRLLNMQLGLVTLRQLEQAGFSRSQVRANLSAERWTRLGHRVIATQTGELTAEQRRWLAVLHAGSGAAIAGLSALEEHGLKGWSRDEVSVVVAPNQRPRPLMGARFHRSSCIEDGKAMTRLPMQRVEVAALWFASVEKRDRTAHGLLAAVVQQRLTTPQRLATWTSRMGLLRGVEGIRAMILELSDGAQSMAEVDVTTMCKDFRLVRPKRQVRHRDASGQVRYTDAEWELPSGGSLILEVDGSHHLDMSTYSDDLRRQRDLTERHVQLVRCSTWELRNEPDQLAATLIRLGVPRTAY
ncbi:MAG: hypothetical protein U0R21_01375 [Nocardioidaceae bacterium]